MTAHERYEQDLPRLLAQLAEGPRPDYRDSLVEATARASQRPAWTFPGRWLRMDITTRPVTMASVPRLPILLFVSLTLLAAAAIGMLVASQPKVPSPFGPAANGIVVYGSDGDLFALDPGSTTPRPFLTGAGADSWPVFSQQGDRVLYLRETDGRHALWVVNADGGEPQALSSPLVGVGAISWSPDGTRVAVAHDDGGYPRVSVYRSDGSGGTTLEVPFQVADPAWRPGHDGQLLVRGRETGQEYDLYLVDVETEATTSLGIPHDPRGWQQYDGQRASWSPDGSRLMFEQGLAQLGTLGRQVIRLRVADVAADGTLSNVRPLELDPQSDYEYMGRWLTTGDGLAFAAQKGCTWQVYVAPGLDVAKATPVGEQFEDCTNEGIDYELSPDASRIVTVRGTANEADPMWIGAIDGTGIEPVAGTITDVPTWQRLAP
ncbi:MAG TPA: hypothetical protein VFY23_04085 [Candidatus Limnocylindrales bacterium]|nr:hypothetical protein [Candidatus Limnocylindrales bacterium]